MTDYSARDIHQLDQSYPDTVKTIDDFTLATAHRARLAEQGPAVFAAELTHGLATTFDNPLSLAGWAAVATVRLMEAGQAWTDDTDAAWAKVDELTAALAEAREQAKDSAYAASQARKALTETRAALAEKDAQLTAANRRNDGLQADLDSATKANTAWANETTAKDAVIDAAKAWRGQYGNTSVRFGDACTGLVAAVDALPAEAVAR